MNDALQAALEAARASGAHHEHAEALLALCEQRPLFASAHAQVLRWVTELRDLAQRVVLSPRGEVLQVQLQAEAMLAAGSPREAFQVAREACRLASRLDVPGLEDRARLVEARAMVRLGRQDDAVRLFVQVIDRELPADQEEPLVEGLAFLAVGEAHLFDGRYDGAYRPLDQAVARLPTTPDADRLRYDALVGLGLLDHRLGDFEAAALRYDAARALADTHASAPEQCETLLLTGSLARGLGRVDAARSDIERAVTLAATTRRPISPMTFPTERLRNLVGSPDPQAMLDATIELAAGCGAEGDLMGYVQLTAIAAALTETIHSAEAAAALLAQVAESLCEGGQQTAADVVKRHLSGYSAA